MKKQKLSLLSVLAVMSLIGCTPNQPISSSNPSSETPASSEENSSGESDATSSMASVTSFTISESSIELKVGASKKLSASVEPAEYKNMITWSTGNPSVARVDGTGKVTAIAAGKTVIKASIGYSYVVECEVTVKADASTVVPLDNAMLQEFSLGYSWDGYYTTRDDVYTKAGVGPVVASCTANRLYYKQWKPGSEDNVPNKDDYEPSYVYHYASKPEEDNSLLYDLGINFNNEVEYKPFEDRNLTGISWPMTWEESQFSNFFPLLDSSDFIDNHDNTYSLDMNKVQTSIAQAIAQQVTGFFKFKLARFTLKSDGKKLVSFEASMAPYKLQSSSSSDSDDSSTSTSTTTTLKVTDSYAGVFTGSGADLCPDLTPVEGTTDKTFDDAMKKLQAGNYTVEVNRDDKQYWEAKASGDVLTWEKKEKPDDWMTSPNNSMGLFAKYKVDDTHTQTVTKINGEYYLAEGVKEEKWVHPSFKMSSVFFTKDTANSDDTKSVYTLNDLSSLPFDNAKDSIFSDFTELLLNRPTVTIAKDGSVTFKNRGTVVTDTLTFTNIGTTKVDTVNASTVHQDTTGLTYADILKTKTNYFEKLTTKYIPEEELAALPAPVMKYANLTAGEMTSGHGHFEYYDGSVGDATATALYNEFVTKMNESSIYTHGTVDGYFNAKDLHFVKQITIDGKTQYLHIEPRVTSGVYSGRNDDGDDYAGYAFTIYVYHTDNENPKAK